MEFGTGEVLGQKYFWIDDGRSRLTFDAKATIHLLFQVVKAYEQMDGRAE